MLGLRVLLLLRSTPLASDPPPTLRLQGKWRFLRWVLGLTGKANSPDAATEISTGINYDAPFVVRRRVTSLGSLLHQIASE